VIDRYPSPGSKFPQLEGEPVGSGGRIGPWLNSSRILHAPELLLLLLLLLPVGWSKCGELYILSH
jgi:hypothetical protein